MENCDFLILGAGITGLSAALDLKDNTIVVEKERVPGGLVRSHCFNNDYWFDHVLHILHFRDKEIQERITDLMAGMLSPCPPVAWIDSGRGITLYPFQLNIGGLNEEDRNKCLSDYAKVYFNKPEHQRVGNYKEFLEMTFGAAMCELFYFPYNEKLYKYDLDKIAADELLWNLHRPSFEEILQGAFNPNIVRTTYNSNAFYPRPVADAPLRGMGTLSKVLADNVERIDLNTRIVNLNLKTQTVHAIRNNQIKLYRFESCLSTLPLPVLMRICDHVPNALMTRVDRLEYAKVFSIALCFKGKRPENTGHWRYYPQSEYPFTRLIFMHEFDELNAPSDGWGLLVEITENSRTENPNEDVLIARTLTTLQKLGFLEETTRLISSHFWTIDPAYVIFTHETKNTIDECFTFLKHYNITSLGRYGNWEYSSMYQNIKAGFSWSEKIRSKQTV